LEKHAQNIFYQYYWVRQGDKRNLSTSGEVSYDRNPALMALEIGEEAKIYAQR
jgi:hypothetical protein